MESKVGRTPLQTLLSYDEFEPMCTWQREDGQDILVLHLPEFKKDQLRIQISNTGILKITRENVVEGKKRSRFQKEVKVAKDYDSNNIHAKFSQGRLRITLPKKILAPPPMLEPSELPSASSLTSLPSDGQNNSINTNGKPISSNIKTKVGELLKSEEFTQIVINVGFVVVAAFSIYVAYKYCISYVQVDED